MLGNNNNNTTIMVMSIKNSMKILLVALALTLLAQSVMLRKRVTANFLSHFIYSFALTSPLFLHNAKKIAVRSC